VQIRGLRRRLFAGVVLAALIVSTASAPAGRVAAAPNPAGAELITTTDLRRWLTRLAADEMLGRGAFTEGYALAAAYVAGELAAMGATPLDPAGTFLQPVTRTEYRVTRRSSLSLTVGSARRTFTQDDHVSFAPLAGTPRDLTVDEVVFAGYGLPPIGAPPVDYTGKLVVLVPGTPAWLADNWPYPSSFSTAAGRAAALAETSGAAAVVAFGAVPPRPDRNGGAPPTVGLTTVLEIDRPRAPVVTADEDVFRLLFERAPVTFDEVRRRAEKGEPLESFAIDASAEIAIDHGYEAVRIDRSHNVVALVPGSDAALRERYVAFGAHLDHVGAVVDRTAPGRANVPIETDPIWNGADDDGSGSAALLGIAKAMIEGPRPRRSVLFVWHTAEEEGLLGSRAFVDQAPVPIEAIEAQLNVDMIGRNRDDDPAMANTVFLIGADRISTDLHNAVVDANDGLAEPLTLDFHYNAGDDPESFYTRSDHYNYASHGIPAVFFFTGTHADYHANTDTVDKILFPKLLKVARLIYAAGFAVANGEPLRRDYLGPRSGDGFGGRLPGPGGEQAEIRPYDREQ
jgi:hypothetical protein